MILYVLIVMISSIQPDFIQQRNQMVNDQLLKRGIRSEQVINAMREVPRHLFVPSDLCDRAYEDRPLPIGFNQTISQPYIVAYMTEQLDVQPTEKVLEIGTGSGYQAAILSQLALQVNTIEIIDSLAHRSKRIVEQLGYTNIHIRAGDGFKGWPEQAPFDKIIVTAAPEEIPQTLVDQLRVGGRMIIPVGPVGETQYLQVVTKTEKGSKKSTKLAVRFVPMIHSNK